jgi:capsular polysaccharide export protein
MYFHLRDGDPEIDSMIASVCALGTGATRMLTDFSVSFAGFPETRAQAQRSVETAKRQPKSAFKRRSKRLVYAVQYNRFRRLFAAHPGSVAVAWNGLTGTRRVYMAAARDAGIGTLYMERAPLPGRVTVDPVGVNQVNGLPRDMGFYRDWAAADPARRGEGWLHLKAAMQARMPRRGDVGQAQDAAGLEAAPYLFVPLQVPDDTQIRQFGGWVGSMEAFIALLGQAAPHLPPGWQLRIKEHPSSKIPLAAALDRIVAAAPDRIVVDNRTDTFLQVARSGGVVTANSSVGLQAFYWEKPVVVLADAFFRAPGLVTPADTAAALAAAFAAAPTLDYDRDLRHAFMNYLDQVYYPQVIDGPDGLPVVAPDLVRPKLAEAERIAAL